MHLLILGGECVTGQEWNCWAMWNINLSPREAIRWFQSDCIIFSFSQPPASAPERNLDFWVSWPHCLTKEGLCCPVPYANPHSRLCHHPSSRVLETPGAASFSLLNILGNKSAMFTVFPSWLRSCLSQVCESRSHDLFFSFQSLVEFVFSASCLLFTAWSVVGNTSPFLSCSALARLYLF